MAQMFRRVFGALPTLCAGEYTLGTESRRARLSCPVCGHEFDLPPGFAPDQSGRVNYAVSCESQACGWWDWAVLESHWELP